MQGTDKISIGLGADQIVSVPRAPPVNLGLPMEDDDMETEEPLEDEIDLGFPGFDSKKDPLGLNGARFTFRQKFTGRHVRGFPDKKLHNLIAHEKSLYDIPAKVRGEVYRLFEAQLHQKIATQLQKNLRVYREVLQQSHVTRVSSFIGASCVNVGHS